MNTIMDSFNALDITEEEIKKESAQLLQDFREMYPASNAKMGEEFNKGFEQVVHSTFRSGAHWMRVEILKRTCTFIEDVHILANAEESSPN